MEQGQVTTIAAILREFTAFLQRPLLQVPAGLRAPGVWQWLAKVAALHIAVMVVVLLPLISLWQEAFDLPSPDAFAALPPEWIIPVVVFIAPVVEELLFRGWMTGRVRALWLLACAIAFGVLLYTSATGLDPLTTAISFLLLVIAAPIGWFLLRRKGVPRWFAPTFPAIFYCVAAGFALAHIVNYPQFSPLALPLVLPQFWGALVLGFVRMRIGLPASILVHAISNGAALAVATILAGSAA